MRPTLEFSSRYGRALTVAAGVVGLVAVVAVALQDGLGEVVRALPLAGAIVLAVWALFWRPVVVVSDGGVLVRNPLRSTHVPWPTYRGLTVQWSLVLHTTDGDVTAWAAPRSSGTAARMHRSAEDVVVAPTKDARLPGTAEDVAAAIGDRHRALADAGFLRDAEQARTAGGIRPERHWHVATIAALVLLTAAAAAVLATA
ncbi:PH domain-containing protein [Cellulomonas sp. P5_C5]